jgi:nitrous oxide reductase accessory protein NosL
MSLLHQYSKLNFFKLFIYIIFVGSFSLLHADEISSAKKTKMFHIGEKVAHSLCNSSLLKKVDLEQKKDILQKELETNICHDINIKHIEALMFYLYSTKEKQLYINTVTPIPKTEKCPVCGMYPYKYSSWGAMIILEGKHYYFDGVKDMMKYYLLKDKYFYDRTKIDHIVVQDFYRHISLNAKKAWYVTGSDIRGPMGQEAVPFNSYKDAKTFMIDHHGTDIIRFDDINIGMLLKH